MDNFWYEPKEEFISNYRKMSVEQLVKHYNKSVSNITYFARKFNLNKFKIVKSLTKDELIFMYKSLLDNEIKVFTNGIFNNDEYIYILIRHMINNILQWDRKSICDNFSTKTLKETGLGGLLGIKKFNTFNYLNKAIPELNIMPWELKSSTVSWTNNNIDSALLWFKNKLLEDKNINNINLAGKFGFRNLIDEYNFQGLCAVKFSSSYTLLFEKMYRQKFSKEEMLKLNYKFEINTISVPTILNNKVYKLLDTYYDLDDRGKTLVNEIIRFSENEKRFPEEKDLNNKNGYISRTQYYKYFNEKSFKTLYNYIVPVYDLSQEIHVDNFRLIQSGQNFSAIIIRPEKIECVRCKAIKDFTENNFPKSEGQKFGLKYTCKKCETEIAYERNLNKLAKKNGIPLDNKYDIILWYEALLKNNSLRQMPEFCYEERNLIDIIRYAINNKLKLNTKEQICNVSTKQFEKCKIDMSVHKLSGKLSTLQKCFPELNISEKDVFPEIYTDEEVDKIMTEWIYENKLSIEDLLSKGVSLTYDNKVRAMISAKFFRIGKSRIDMLIWYFKRHNIVHPITGNQITIYDFAEKPSHFWEIKDNRICFVKQYCESKGLNEEILNNTELLKEWIFNNFRAEILNNEIKGFSKYTSSYYNTFIESYPQVYNNKTLFDWEWHQFNKSDKPTLIRQLRELVFYRLNQYIINPKEDIPHYINYSFIKSHYSKFVKQINKKRFDTFYDWCCVAFPEHVSFWKPEDFGLCVAFDGARCNSLDEKIIYEFLKVDYGLKYIEAIGFQKNGKHTFILPNEHEDNRYCPDFVIEYIDINNRKMKLKKPLYIEYYGLYSEIYNTKVMINYREKTYRKNDYFKSLDSILFIDLYQNDLNNNFDGLKNKLNNILN